MGLQRCKTLHAKRCKITNSLREVRRTLSHMYRRLYGTMEGRNVVLNPVPSHYPHLLLPEKTVVSLLSFDYLRVTNDKKNCELILKQKNTSSF